MAKKHKHEEHVNHERWVISFADMMTLLFALFVVLYAMGVQDLEKLKKLKKSIQFAFNIAGSGKTQDTGIFEKQEGGGDVQVPAPLVTAQDGGMREFLQQELEDFQEELGRSLDIVMTDDTISMTAPLSEFFEPMQSYPVKQSVRARLDRIIDGSLSFTSDIRISIETLELPIARAPNGGRVITSGDLCRQRLQTLARVVKTNPAVRPNMVGEEFRLQNERVGRGGDWEDLARVTIAFSNTRPENR